MTIETWLKRAQADLETAGIGTARLDALVLLEDELNKSRTHLLAHPEINLTPEKVHVLNNLIARRAQNEPLAYLRGKSEFYGREFVVSPAVLEPRPESETMIELLLKLPKPAHPSLADVGTGSGALGITAKLELPAARVDLLEIDDEAMIIAKRNVIKFATSINVIQSDLLAASANDYDILLCNLPYVPDEFHINEAAQHEPRIAIFGGKDGLDLYRELFLQLRNRKNKPLLILCESLPLQHEPLAATAKAAGFALQETNDFVQVFARID